MTDLERLAKEATDHGMSYGGEPQLSNSKTTAGQGRWRRYRERGGRNMYKCERCDWTGSASELGHYTEYRGECHGAPAWETLPCCPECGYDVEDIEEE